MSKKSDLQERRKERRVTSNIPIKLKHAEGDVIAQTYNISCSGVLCSVNRKISLMTKMDITLLLPCHKGEKIVSKKIKTNGVVVRTDEDSANSKSRKYNIAIYFTDISTEDRHSIAKYVNYQHLKEENSKLHNG